MSSEKRLDCHWTYKSIAISKRSDWFEEKIQVPRRQSGRIFDARYYYYYYYHRTRRIAHFATRRINLPSLAMSDAGFPTQ